MFGPSGVSIGHILTVMRVVHVADFEGSAVTRQTARAECRKTALVRQFRKRVRSDP